MDKQTNLYLITTSGLGDFYVTGDDPGEAQHKLVAHLARNNAGFEYDRKVLKIEFLAEKRAGKDLNRFVD